MDFSKLSSLCKNLGVGFVIDTIEDDGARLLINTFDHSVPLALLIGLRDTLHATEIEISANDEESLAINIY